MVPKYRANILAVITFFAIVMIDQPARSEVIPDSLPQIVENNGRHALFVDGQPYLMLAAQVNNSSAWPAVLPKVWPVMEALHVNTMEAPIYWEQFEPTQGKFDYILIDTLLNQARDHHVHLVLLWFGTWKNGSAHYRPLWMKHDPNLYPNIIAANGQELDSPSPYSAQALAADIAAFTALMQHLKETDPQHTVLMVQVENEPGTWGGVRDFSPQAQQLFAQPVSPEVLKAMGKPVSGDTKLDWKEAFGDDADEFFHAWSIARYVGQVAAAGKAVYPLPFYINVSIRDPFNPGRPPQYESGGGTDNVIPIWKAAAPAIDLIAPDIYVNDTRTYLKILDLYNRPDNPLLVPETQRNKETARFCFAAIAHGAIGFSPFGMDYTALPDTPPGAPPINEESLLPFASNYQAIGPMDRQIARLSFDGKLHAAVENEQASSNELNLGNWNATVSYGLPAFGPGDHPKGNPTSIGRVLIGQLADNDFLVTGFFCRVSFRPADSLGKKPWQFLQVEQGQYHDGTFIASRIWNGDQTDWGLNFDSTPTVLRVSLSLR